MEANLKIIECMLKDVSADASLQAKRAIMCFAALYGQKLVRTVMNVRVAGKKITAQNIKFAYEISKKQRSIQMQAKLQQKRIQDVQKINNTQLITKIQHSYNNTANSAVDVKIYQGYVFHVNLQKQMQLAYKFNRH